MHTLYTHILMHASAHVRKHIHKEPIHLAFPLLVNVHHSHMSVGHQHSSHLVHRAYLPQQIHHEDAGSHKQHPSLHVQGLPGVGGMEGIDRTLEEGEEQEGQGERPSHRSCKGYNIRTYNESHYTGTLLRKGTMHSTICCSHSNIYCSNKVCVCVCACVCVCVCACVCVHALVRVCRSGWMWAARQAGLHTFLLPQSHW